MLNLRALTVSYGLWVVPAVASAQADSWMSAQQAFTRFDYAASLRYATQVLQKQPNHAEARRLAAKAARELGRFVDCLKFMSEFSNQQLMSDDIGLVGECAVRSRMTPRAQSLLNQQLQSADNRDIAAYWLGRQAYLKEEWASAEKFLSMVQIVPDRLEKERAKMLERLRDVLRQGSKPAPPAVAVEPAPQPTPQPVALPSVPQVQVSVPPAPTVRPSLPQKKKPAPPFRPTAPVEKTGGSFFANGGFRLTTDYAYTGNSVSLEPFSQSEYGKTYNSESIKKTKGGIGDVAGTIALHGGYGLRRRESDFFRIELVGAMELDATMASRTIWLYQPPTRLRYPLGAVGTSGRGLELGPVPEVRFSFGKNFEAELGTRFKLNVPDVGRARTLVDIHTLAVLKNDFAELQAGYVYDRYFVSGTSAFSGSNVLADFRVDGLGLFSLGAPPGYALFRYARYVAMPSPHVVRFMIMEGDFLEFNVAPRLQIADKWEAMAWFHWVRAKRRQYWSTADLQKYYRVSTLDTSSQTKETYEPTALYGNTSTEFSGSLTWDGPAGVEASFGAAYRMTRSNYVEFNPLDIEERVKNKSEPYRYQDLINRGGGTSVRVFASAGVGF
jgi:hypothetical protein